MAEECSPKLRRLIKQMRDCASGNGEGVPCMGCWENVARAAGFEPFPSAMDLAAEKNRDNAHD